MNFSSLEHAHLAQCAALFVGVFNAPPWNEDWKEQSVAQRLNDCYHTPGFYGLTTGIGDEIVGFALGFIERWDANAHFYLKEMCVATKHQRCGVGTALMSALEDNLKNQGVAKLYLHTARDTPAQAFYEKQGCYVSPKMIMMAKWLTAGSRPL